MNCDKSPTRVSQSDVLMAMAERYMSSSVSCTSVSTEIYNYIRKYLWEKITELCRTLSRTDDHLALDVTEVSGGFTLSIRGPKEARELAVSHVNDIVQGVKTTRFILDIGTVSESKISESLIDLEQTNRCYISYKIDRRIGKGSVKIRGCLKKIEEVKADVLVNSTNQRLTLNVGGGVSAALVKAGGETIQADLRTRYPNGINPGEIAATASGKLTNCKAIYHGCLPTYYTRDETYLEKCYGTLVVFILNCLKKAGEHGHKSIAFPALGTGNLQYPEEEVVQLLYQTVSRYLDMNPRSTLEEIKFVIHPSAKSKIKKYFLMEDLSCHLETKREDGIWAINKDLQNSDRKRLEARLQVGHVFVQIINSSVKSVSEITNHILILWNETDLGDETSEDNPFLFMVDQSLQQHVSTRYAPMLMKSKCEIDEISLENKTLIHSVYSKDDVDAISTAVCSGFKLAKKKHLSTLTIPIVSDGDIFKILMNFNLA